MVFNSQQVCMDSSDLLLRTMHEDSRLERRLRPHLDQPLKCPRCDSTHTKFCYYNNYSLSQPRYFCKTCRRYWTKGGTLRNIPVGGGCRKNKKVSSKKTDANMLLVSQNNLGSSSHNHANFHQSLPDYHFQFSNLDDVLGNPSFEETKLVDDCNSYRDYDFLGSAEKGMMGGVGVGDLSFQNRNLHQNSHGICSLYGISIDENRNHGGTHFVEECQRLLLPYHDDKVNDDRNAKILAIDWQEQGCSDSGNQNFSDMNGFGSSWNAIVNGYGPSASHPLV